MNKHLIEFTNTTIDVSKIIDPRRVLITPHGWYSVDVFVEKQLFSNHSNIIEWIEENLTGKYMFIASGQWIRIKFQKMEDAMLFKFHGKHIEMQTAEY